MKFEYAILEWIWDGKSIRVNLPRKDEQMSDGDYKEVAQTLTDLGAQGWEVVTCAAQENWLFWTLKRAL